MTTDSSIRYDGADTDSTGNRDVTGRDRGVSPPRSIRPVPKPVAEFSAIWLMLGVMFVVTALALWLKR
jgi:hypothetical protein